MPGNSGSGLGEAPQAVSRTAAPACGQEHTDPGAQGKEQLLGDLRQVLNISMDDHKRHLDAALADPRVQAIKRGEEDVPVSFAGR